MIFMELEENIFYYQFKALKMKIYVIFQTLLVF
jgi:hypothetical protein